MASFDWFPWYPIHYRRATRHLTDIQDLIYRRLIDEYMETREALPDNDIALASISRVCIDEWKMARVILLPFFRQSDGKLFHKKCDEILSGQTATIKKKSNAGAAGAAKRWANKHIENKEKNSSSHPPAKAGPMPIDSKGHNKTGEEKEKLDSAVPEEAARPPDPCVLVIGAFDDARAEIFGEELRRRFPTADDKVYAERFLATGADVPWLKAFFLERMAGMQADSGKKPKSLKYFDDAVSEGYTRYLTAKKKPLSKPGGHNAVALKDQYAGMTREEILESKRRQNEDLQRIQQGKRA